MNWKVSDLYLTVKQMEDHMNKEFEKLSIKLIRQFGKDRNMAMATVVNSVPTIRIVDTFFYDNCFYIVTHESSEKVQQILSNKYVSLCTNFHEFQGEAFNIGHPLDDRNKEIREKLIDAFSNWYFAHNDESDPKMCILQVKINTAFTYFNKIGYNVDFKSQEITKFPFNPKEKKV